MAIALTVGTLLAISIFDEIYVLNGTALNTRSILIQVYNTTFVTPTSRTGRRSPSCSPALTAILGGGYALLLRRATI